MRNSIPHKLILTLTLGGLLSCQSSYPDTPEEDYNKLFPFTGIDKTPPTDAPVSRACNPELAIESYRYLGETSPLANATNYTITLTCSYQELRHRTDAEPTPPKVGSEASRIEIRYIDAKGHLVILTSDPNQAEGYVNNQVRYQKLSNAQEEKISFAVRSGYPLYLSVSGTAPENTKVKAKLTATAQDDSLLIPTLESMQTQTREGQDRLPQPYCEYILLP